MGYYAAEEFDAALIKQMQRIEPAELEIDEWEDELATRACEGGREGIFDATERLETCRHISNFSQKLIDKVISDVTDPVGVISDLPREIGCDMWLFHGLFLLISRGLLITHHSEV